MNEKLSFERIRKTKERQQFEPVDDSRRDFLKKAPWLLAAIMVPSSIEGCSKKSPPSGKSSEKPQLSPQNALSETPENDKYKLPKVEFKSSTTFSDPKLPAGVDKSELPALRKKMIAKLTAHFEPFKGKPDGVKDAFNDVTMKCLNIIQNLHPAFANYLPVLQRQCRGQAGCLYEYINKFLIPERKFLYVRSAPPHPKANLYDIKESSDVLINDVNETQAHFLGNGMLNDSNASDTISEIMQGEDLSIAVWPEIIEGKKKKFHERLKVTDPARKKKIGDELDRGTLFHESLHIHLFRKYPNIPETPFNLAQVYQVDGQTSLRLGGAMRYNTIHELCAIAGELQTATDPSIMLGYVSDKKPITQSYQFAMYLVFLSSLKHLPESHPFRKEKLKALNENPNNIRQIFNTPEMAKFYRENADLTLINRVGKDLYKIGIDIMEKLFAGAQQMQMNRMQ